MQIPVSRVVAFVVTPITTAASGVGTAWLARHFPGLPKLDPDVIAGAGAAGASAALAGALKWLHGRQAFDLAEQRAQHAIAAAEAWEKANPEVDQAASELGKVAEAAAGEIVAKAADAIGAANPDGWPDPAAPEPEAATVTPITDAPSLAPADPAPAEPAPAA